MRFYKGVIGGRRGGRAYAGVSWRLGPFVFGIGRRGRFWWAWRGQAMPSLTDVGDLAARLRVIDEFSAPIKAALDQLAELQAAVERFRGASAGVSGSFSRMGSAIARAMAPLDAMAARLDSMEAPINAAADRLSAVADRSAAIAASAIAAARAYASIGAARVPRAPAAPLLPGAGGGGGGGGRGRGGEGGGGGFGNFAKGAAEGAGLGYAARRAFSIPGLAIGFAGYESFKQAMTENLALTQSLAMFNMGRLSPAQKQADMSMLRDLARQSAIGTIYTEAETARAMLGAAQISGFTGPKGMAQFASVFPIALRMAEVGQMQGLGSIKENIKAAIGYAHLTGRYSAKALVPGLDQVLAIAERTHSTIAQVLTTEKYGMPMAVAAGANVDQTADLIGFLMRAGLGRSAGYSVGQMILGVLKTGGALNAQLSDARNAAQKQLGAHAEHFKNMKGHQAALHALGILDAAGRLTVLNKSGGIDLAKVVADIQRFAATHTKALVEGVLYNAFGTRGLRGAALIAEQQKRLAAFEKLVAGTLGAAAQQSLFAHTPLQEFEQLLARLEDIGNVLAANLLPALGEFLAFLDRTLGSIDRFLARHHLAAGAAGGAAVGAAVGSIVPGVGTAVGAAVGAGVGVAAVGLSEAAQPDKHAPTHSANSLAAAIRRRALHEPIVVRPAGTHGDPIFTHPVGGPAPAPGPMTINQDFHVTVNGIADALGITGLMNEWWGTHRGDVAAAAKDAVQQQVQQNRRRTFLDHGLAMP